MLRGNGVSAGIGFASALVWHTPIARDYVARKASQPEVEHNRFQVAHARLLERFDVLHKKTTYRFGSAEASIFEAYKMMLCDDEGLLDPLKHKLYHQNLSAEYAVLIQFSELTAQFTHIENDYLRQRSEDLLSLRDQILRELQGATLPEISHLDRPTIIVLDTISPTDLANIDLSRLEGIICESGAYSSHAAIIARTLGIPAVMGAANAVTAIQNSETIAIDGETGEIWIRPDEKVVAELHQRADRIAQARKQVQLYRGRPTVTMDGKRIELSASASGIEEINTAMRADAEAVGLFRSELLFVSAEEYPDEEYQYIAYREILKSMNGKAVTVRTFDGGKPNAQTFGNKPKHEDNPVLGYRGIRMSLGRPSFFRMQLRALLRASAYGHIRLMFPMISNLDELLEAKAAFEQVKGELRRENIPFDENMPLGLLISVPSTALMAEAMAPHVEFFSIGINDLLQFTLAVDRSSPHLAHLYHQFHPSILRVMKWIVDAAHSNNISCNVCGEAPGYQLVLPLLLGMGMDGFSINPSMILTTRKTLNSCSYTECGLLANEILEYQSASEVQKKLAAFMKEKCIL